MKINGLKSKPIWKNITCSCSNKKNDQGHKYPLIDCVHCHYQEAEDSLPKKDFKIIEKVYDKDGKDTGKTKTKIIKEITIVRGKHDDIQGWIY